MLELAWEIKFVLHTNLLKLNKFCLKYKTFQERRLVVLDKSRQLGPPKEAGREKIFSLPAACRLFSRGVIFTRARVSPALLSLTKMGTTRSLSLNRQQPSKIQSHPSPKYIYEIASLETTTTKFRDHLSRLSKV